MGYIIFLPSLSLIIQETYIVTDDIQRDILR